MECIALCETALGAADKAALLAVVDENLCHPAAAIQDAAAAALHAFARSYLQGASSTTQKTESENPATHLCSKIVSHSLTFFILIFMLHAHKAENAVSLKPCQLIHCDGFMLESWLSGQSFDVPCRGTSDHGRSVHQRALQQQEPGHPTRFSSCIARAALPSAHAMLA